MVVQSISTSPYPKILARHVEETNPANNEKPRKVTRRFHGYEVTLWQGYVHHTDVEGYVPNLRLKYYLNQWEKSQGNGREPTTDDIYSIMVGADDAERRDSQKPFQVERIAENIVRNGVREPIIVYYPGPDKAELWDGNRRFFGTKHIMKAGKEEYISARPRVEWVPAYVLEAGDETTDKEIKHCILTECNFVDPEQIPWPSYVKAEQIHQEFTKRTQEAHGDSTVSREVKIELAKEYGLKGWRTADRWIKMYKLASEFKEFQEEEQERDPTDVDLLVQSRFEYFDELSKNGVYGPLEKDSEARDEVFQWLWDGKFKAFTDVRQVPKIISDPQALKRAKESDEEAIREAIKIVNANDPLRYKDKSMPNERIKQFAAWLDSFRREDYKILDADAVDYLQTIVKDVSKMAEALIADGQSPAPEVVA